MPDNPNLKSNPDQAHQRFCELTRVNLTCSIDRLYHWELFCLRFTLEDLELVIKWVLHEKKLGRPARSLVWRNLIQCDMHDRFEEDLESARNWAEKRRTQPPADPNKVKALRATGRLIEEREAKPVGDVIAGMKALNELRALRDSL